MTNGKKYGSHFFTRRLWADRTLLVIEQPRLFLAVAVLFSFSRYVARQVSQIATNRNTADLEPQNPLFSYQHVPLSKPLYLTYLQMK